MAELFRSSVLMLNGLTSVSYRFALAAFLIVLARVVEVELRVVDAERDAAVGTGVCRVSREHCGAQIRRS